LKISISGIDAIILFDKSLRRYFTGFSSSFGIAVMTENESYFITDKRYFEAAEKIIKDYILIPYEKDALLVLLKELNIKKIGAILELLTADRYLNITENGYTITDVSKEIYETVAIKNKNALYSIRKACSIAEKAYSMLLTQIKTDITEKQLAVRLESLMVEYGAEEKSFDTIVAFGKNTAVPHHQTGNTKLKEGMPILIDFGCRVNGFCSDMTRTFYFGKPSIAFKNAYIEVWNAHENAKSIIQSGIKAGIVDKLARDILQNHGYDKFFTHSLGHGIGYEIHEYPYLRKDSNTILKDGMVFSIEPGVYFKGKFGIRIEDTVTIINGRAKSFMSYTKNLEYIDNGKKEKVQAFKTVVKVEN
jgi:Xaa-Pro aminopeptidase